MLSDIATAALARLTRGDCTLTRAARIARECAERGEIGMLTPGEYPPCGRIMVPAAVLSDLVAVAAVHLSEQPQ